MFAGINKLRAERPHRFERRLNHRVGFLTIAKIQFPRDTKAHSTQPSGSENACNRPAPLCPPPALLDHVDRRPHGTPSSSVASATVRPNGPDGILTVRDRDHPARLVSPTVGLMPTTLLRRRWRENRAIGLGSHGCRSQLTPRPLMPSRSLIRRCPVERVGVKRLPAPRAPAA